MSVSRISDLPVTEADIDAAIARFAVVMREKMVKNIRKGHWLDLKFTKAYLLSRMRDEQRELEQALANEPAEAGIRECADVANFAMMLADYLSTCEKCGASRFSLEHVYDCADGPGKTLP